MIGKSTIVWIGLATLASGILYHTSYRAQEQAERLASLNRQIVTEQEAIQVLKAEWAFLNDPNRIERLSAQHLLLQPTQAHQIALLDSLPDRMPDAPPPSTPIPGHKPGHKPGSRPSEGAPLVASIEGGPSGKRPDTPALLAKFGAVR